MEKEDGTPKRGFARSSRETKQSQWNPIDLEGAVRLVSRRLIITLDIIIDMISSTIMRLWKDDKGFLII